MGCFGLIAADDNDLASTEDTFLTAAGLVGGATGRRVTFAAEGWMVKGHAEAQRPGRGGRRDAGPVGLFDDVSEKNSAVVGIILKSGAVIYCKTNVPQTMTVDSHNNIFGRMLNPHNTSLPAGGSSGGEGAIVRFRGSPLGLGTDVGGLFGFQQPVMASTGFVLPSAASPAGDLKICIAPRGWAIVLGSQLPACLAQ
ncbi:hypothetical protein MY11210_007822 [Beauveria gryllotalpidicola]